ncbi:unnamed protein product [Onchocerca flexuosa]|uniref:PH domain-containing protein n=1 Tax=Onchocerca flexuosa TaxID=387005 RepID=A0A183I631_9BILA|nr:unnamed protein product [Onchocerca flexuosa]
MCGTAEDFDDLICLDEEDESLESTTSESLSEIKQQIHYSRFQPESYVNHREKHDNIVRHRFPDNKQMSSKCCSYEKTCNLIVVRTSAISDYISCFAIGLDFSVTVNHTNLLSTTLPIYGDDEDWPYLSGDVDEEAVRLAASLDPDATEKAKDGSQHDQRNKPNATEKMTNRWKSQYRNNDESSHCSKTPDKLDGIWSLHLWKSMYSTIFVSCVISASILEKCCRITYAPYHTVLLIFSSVILQVRQMPLKLLFTVVPQIGEKLRKSKSSVQGAREFFSLRQYWVIKPTNGSTEEEHKDWFEKISLMQKSSKDGMASTGSLHYQEYLMYKISIYRKITGNPNDSFRKGKNRLTVLILVL